MKRPSLKLILSACLSVCIGFVAFALGEYQANRTNELDGEAGMLGFVLLVAFGGLGASCLIAAIALWFLTLGDECETRWTGWKTDAKGEVNDR